MIVANPMQVKATAHAHVKTDKIDAGTRASRAAASNVSKCLVDRDSQGA